MLPGNTPDIFLDTDVAFDILSRREPFHEPALHFLHLAAAGKVRLVLAENSLANLFYLALDIYKLQNAIPKLIDFITVCEIVPAGKMNCLRALQSSFTDKEDALQYFTALHAQCDYFITRNIKDFRKHKDPSLPVYSPKEFIKLFSLK